jgi:hypothetical protein
MHAGLLDDVMQMFQRAPFRCRGCQCRFYRRIVEPEPGPEVSGTPSAGQKQKAAG